jgi:hypothetical protein
MKDETATQVNDVLGRECSEQELSQFEAYVDALGGGDIEEAIRLFDQFPAEDHEPLIEFMCRKLDAAAPPPVELAPVAQEPRPDPDEASVTMSEHVATVSRWGGEDEHPADAAALEAFRATSAPDRRRLEGRRLTVKDCRRLAAKRVAPRTRESRPAPSRKRSLSRSSSRSADSGDDSDSSEPPERRFCENERCQADITHLGTLARYCDNACKQQAWRDRRLVELLDEMVGTIEWRLSCKCQPKRNMLEPGHCHQCGYPRGVVTLGWVRERGPRAQSFVSTRGLPPRELRIRPDRALAAKLRRTRRERKAAA